MARSSPFGTETPDITAINLSRLLSRLEQNVLSSEADPKLRRSSYERTRVGAVCILLPAYPPKNLEYARTLLLRLEHSSSSIKIQSRKQAAQDNLIAQRALIKKLNERLYELEQLDDDDDDDDVSDSAEGEDLLGEDEEPAALTSETQQRTDTPPDQNTSTPHPAPLNDPQTSRPADQSPSTLRSRRPPATSPTTNTATTTSLSPTLSQTRTTETLLTHNRTEQETLTTSLLTLAQALKTSSLSFAASLESEKEILARAGEGLDKGSAGMEAAEKRMGMVRRMSEGRGLWGRLLMYVWIGGLWVVALVVVFVLPKLRF
ncbi:MAG: hypothetical protein M1830_003904 [Pleopsidium flavum]|nr:MAG: hypothetical protein M1830_003904 [Pleopsidium flavum]